MKFAELPHFRLAVFWDNIHLFDTYKWFAWRDQIDGNLARFPDLNTKMTPNYSLYSIPFFWLITLYPHASAVCHPWVR